MNALFLLLAAVSSVVARDGIPACASSCINSAVAAAGCALTDKACQCGPTRAPIASMADPCLLEACNDLAAYVQAETARAHMCQEFLTAGKVQAATTPAAAAANPTAATGVAIAVTATGTSSQTLVTQSSQVLTGDSATITSQAVATQSSSSRNAAATPAALGAGALVGLLGVAVQIL